MKRTCAGCKALIRGGDMRGCKLGYNIQATLKYTAGQVGCNVSVYETKPLEECPKPYTFKMLRKIKEV